MKFQMEITKPYCYVSWHFNSLALRLTPNPGQAWAGRGWGQGWIHQSVVAQSNPCLEEPCTSFNVWLSPSCNS